MSSSADRIRAFKAAYPHGRLTSTWELVNAGSQYYVVVTAQAWRVADDECPGVGLAWEPVPGRRSITKDSELQCAQTAAWGRAIVAALAVDFENVASSDEIAHREGGDDLSGGGSDPQSLPASGQPPSAPERRGPATAGAGGGGPSTADLAAIRRLIRDECGYDGGDGFLREISRRVGADIESVHLLTPTMVDRLLGRGAGVQS